MPWTLPDDLPSSSEHWASPEFRDELTAWVTEQVGEPRAMQQVKLRSWSTVWRVETDDGVFYAKQNCPLQNFEAALLAELRILAPDDIVPVTAVDTTRGFLLTPDQGPVIAQGDEATNLRVWRDLVVAAFRLQRAVAPDVAGLVTRVGLTRMPLERAEEYAADRVEALAALPAHDPRRLDPEIAIRLRRHLPTVGRWAEEVAALGLPLTLNHNDLHENNAFDTPTGLRFFDFGDTVVSHPLEVLLIPLNIVGGDLDGGPGDPRVLAVADAALEVWSDLAPMRDLRAALPAALQLGRLARTESWLRCLPSMNPAERAEFGGTAATWLATLTEDAPARF